MAALPQQPTILSFEDARRLVERHAAEVSPGEVETEQLLACAGRVLAKPVFADRDFPPFRRAMRDGYAVRARDLAHLPVNLEVVAEIKAGAGPEDLPIEVLPGQAAAIMTGAPTPTGADAVVMVEYSSLKVSRVTITRSVESGDNVASVGSEARQGDVLLPAGVRIDYRHCGCRFGRAGLLSVFQRPQLPSFQPVTKSLSRQTPWSSPDHQFNSYSLAAQVKGSGGARIVEIAATNPASPAIQEGLELNLLLLAGGVSMGKYDLVEQVLAELGAEFFFTGAQIQPGRPIVFGRAWGKYFFGLPGNPVSTMVTFELFARVMLEALAGLIPRKLTFLHARLKSEIKTKMGLTRFLPGLLSGEFERAEVARALARLGRCHIHGWPIAGCIPPDRGNVPESGWR
jgi:molybdopterin molybdotransferase